MTTTESQTNQSEVTTQSPRILTPPINKYTYEVYVDGLCHAINLFISYTKSESYQYFEEDESLVKVALQVKENIYNIPTSVLCYCYDFEELGNVPFEKIDWLELKLFQIICTKDYLFLSSQEIFNKAKEEVTEFPYDTSRYTTIQNIINGLYVEEPDLKEEELEENEMFEMQEE